MPEVDAQLPAGFQPSPGPALAPPRPSLAVTAGMVLASTQLTCCSGCRCLHRWPLTGSGLAVAPAQGRAGLAGGLSRFKFRFGLGLELELAPSRIVMQCPEVCSHGASGSP